MLRRLIRRLNLHWLVAVGFVVFILARGAVIFFGVGSAQDTSFQYRAVPYTPAESRYSTHEVPR